jgi:hypothetical protein
MAAKTYAAFTPADIAALGLQNTEQPFMSAVQDITPSSLLLAILADNKSQPLATEKAKSEYLIAPVLSELRRNNPENLTVYSGYALNIDRTRGLFGYCDFILSQRASSMGIQAPIFCIVEAKNEDITNPKALAQCAAEMYAARLLNEEKNNHIPIIYGAVSTGFEWFFLRLEGNIIYTDTANRFQLANLPQLLGALQRVIDKTFS